MLMPPVKADVAASVDSVAAAGDGCWMLTAACSAAVELLVTVATFLAQNIFVRLGFGKTCWGATYCVGWSSYPHLHK